MAKGAGHEHRNNKAYLDAGPWPQRDILLHSNDDGNTWLAPIEAACDPSGTIFNWDLRVAAARDEQLVSLAWTYDRKAGAYLNIHSRLSHDAGLTWTAPERIGIADQAGRPANVGDGRIVLAWVDRFGLRSIRARLADDAQAPLLPHPIRSQIASDGTANATVAGTLSEMDAWSFGLRRPPRRKMETLSWSIMLVNQDGSTPVGRACDPRVSGRPGLSRPTLQHHLHRYGEQDHKRPMRL